MRQTDKVNAEKNTMRRVAREQEGLQYCGGAVESLDCLVAEKHVLHRSSPIEAWQALALDDLVEQRLLSEGSIEWLEPVRYCTKLAELNRQ